MFLKPLLPMFLVIKALERDLVLLGLGRNGFSWYLDSCTCPLEIALRSAEYCISGGGNSMDNGTVSVI